MSMPTDPFRMSEGAVTMARVSCTWTFADGDSIAAVVDVGTSYPDALSEAKMTCLEMLREAMVYGIVAQAEDEDDE